MIARILAGLLVVFLVGCDRHDDYLYPWKDPQKKPVGVIEPPSCQVRVSAATIVFGESIRATLTTDGAVTGASIDGTAVDFPSGVKKWAPDHVGTFTVRGRADGPGGARDCEASFVVREGPPSCSLAAVPGSVLTGDPLTLRLQSRGAVTAAAIEGQAVAIPLGERVITQSTAGTFQATATVAGPGGSSTCTAIYQVKDRAPTCTLTATPARLVVGDTVTLTVSVAGQATQAAINGQPVTLPTGRVAFAVPASGTFTAQAMVVGPGGAGQCSAAYSVTDKAPTCALTASPATVFAGDTVALEMQTFGAATTASVDGSPVALPQGELRVATTAAGTFTAVGKVSGPGGSGTCYASYLVKPKPSCTLSVSPARGLVGDTFTLTINVNGPATSASIDGQSVALPGGTRTVVGTAAGTFTATGTVGWPGGSAQCTAVYTVGEKAPTCTLTATPDALTLGDSVLLSLQAFGAASSATIEGTSVSVPQGTLRLVPPSAGTITATARVSGPGGTGSCQATYVVKPKAPSCTLSVSPASGLVGQPFTFTLTAIGAASAAAIDGQSVAVPTGTRTVIPTAAGSFTAHGSVQGPGGVGSCDVTYAVQDVPPACSLSAQPATVKVGDPVTLTLASTGKVTDASIDGVPGTQRKITPGAAGTFTAVGRVAGPAGSAECRADYRVEEKPVPPTCTLVADNATVWLGKPVTFTLVALGGATSAAIEGQSVPVPSGSRAITPTAVGPYTAHGSVQGPGGTGACQATVQIQQPPQGPTCTVFAYPDPAQIGDQVTIRLIGQGGVTTASINGKAVSAPNGILTVAATAPGVFALDGQVSGPTGVGHCTGSYTVQSVAPSCQLQANPNPVLTGQTLTLSLQTFGNVTTASIDGQPVTFPTGTLTRVPTVAGAITAGARVTGPGGTGTCSASYVVNSPNKPVKLIHTVKDTIAPKGIDIVWVIDNSGSMAPYQQSVADNTAAFMQEFAKYPGLQWKMGLISTDKKNAPFVGFTPTTQLDFHTTDPVGTFKTAVASLGIGGSGREEGFEPLQKALTENPDFLGTDRVFAPIFVTDAPEQSWMTAQDLLDFLATRLPKLRLAGYGIFGATDMGCEATDDPWTYADSEYAKFINAVNGKVYPICKPDFGVKLAEIGKNLVSQSVFSPRAPLPSVPVAGSLEVRFHGSLLPAAGTWNYEAATNTLVFTNLDFATGPKEDVEISYLTAARAFASTRVPAPEPVSCMEDPFRVSERRPIGPWASGHGLLSVTAEPKSGTQYTVTIRDGSSSGNPTIVDADGDFEKPDGGSVAFSNGKLQVRRVAGAQILIGRLTQSGQPPVDMTCRWSR